MLHSLKRLFWQIRNSIDARLKFPDLNEGDTAIQAGFDFSASFTSDLILMRKRVGKTGLVIGIDPDPYNIEGFSSVLAKKEYDNIQLWQSAIYDQPGKMKLMLAKRASWNMLNHLGKNESEMEKYTEDTIEVPVNTLDNIIVDLNIASEKIRHVSLTVNGAEFWALKGMSGLLKQAEKLSLTIIAGRPGVEGTVEGQPDYTIISKVLQEYGYQVRFYRMSHLFWWGFIHQLLLRKKWVFGRKPYGVLFAKKGLPFQKFQSFS